MEWNPSKPTAWSEARAHSFLAMTRDSARRVSKPGSVSPQVKFRVRIRNY
jgi:hypothetical protein